MKLPALMHPARRGRTLATGTRDPEADWQDIYRQLVLLDFPLETRGGFQVAFYRPQAVPRMAAVLAGSGHIKANPRRRTFDTGIVIFEIIVGGFDSDRGHKMIRLMKALHDRPDIHQEDMTYVLNSLMVVPTRFIEKMGWRPLLEVERFATWRFWSELGRRTGVQSLAGSYAEAEEQFDRYEASGQLSASADGRELTEMIIGAFANWTPRLLRPHLGQITSALIDDPRFSDALGLPRPRWTIRSAMHLLYRIRRIRQRLSRPGTEPGFTPGQPVSDVYPNGYNLDDVGPRVLS